MNEEPIIHTIRSQYGEVARSTLSNDMEDVAAVAKAFGYTSDDLAELPHEANMGLACGNPVAIAGLREGEVVVDLGCGGGIDVFLAAKRVGSSGKAIGIDMTPDMLQRAKAGALKQHVTNVEFHLSRIEQLPLEDDSVDCVISNCVINLVPEKAQVFREIRRVLKPGGRLVISDIALKRPLPEAIARDALAYVGCIAGAIEVDAYRRLLVDAGFQSIVVQDTGANLNAYAELASNTGPLSGGCCSSNACSATDTLGTDTLGTDLANPVEEPILSPVHEGLKELLNRFDANQYAASVRVHAVKPTGEDRTGARRLHHVRVYDKPMCCASGVCGPQVDPQLPRFASDLEWLRSLGHQVERYNLAQQPQAFVDNPQIQKILAEEGVDGLPVILVDDAVVSRKEYPSRDRLAKWTSSDPSAKGLPVLERTSGTCCG